MHTAHGVQILWWVSSRLDEATGSPMKLIATPVRRSTRRSVATLPAGLRDHDIVVDSVHDVTGQWPLVPRPGDITEDIVEWPGPGDIISEDRLLLRDNDALRLEWKTDHRDNKLQYKCLVHTTDDGQH